MKYLSVCSGIEAATVAWHPLGWRAEAFSEIEAFPSKVLTHHYPEVKNLGDMTKFEEWNLGTIDLLVGGTPCQSFSVAGLRKGLDDPRGNLMLTFGAIAKRFGPKWLVWENVPGVLSSNNGRDFATFLGMLAELGYGFAYRVLDAQYFGVAQRRRRVFVVGCLGDWRSAAAVLFERDSLSGNPAPSRETRKGTSPSPQSSATYGGSNSECADTVTSKWAKGSGGPSGNEGGLFVAHTLRAEHDASEDGTGRGTPLVPVDVPEVMSTLLSSTAGISRPGNAVTEHETYIPMAFAQNTRNEVRWVNGDGQIVGALAAEAGMKQTTYVAQPMVVRESGQGYWMEDDIAGTLRAEGEDRPSRPSHVIGQPISIHPHCIGRSPEAGPQGKEYLTDGTAYCMDSRGQPQAVAQPMVLMDQGGSSMDVRTDGVTRTLRRETHGHEPVVMQPILIDTMNHVGRGDNHSFADFQLGAPSYTLTKKHSHAMAQPINFQDVADPLTACFAKHHGASGGKDSLPRNHITQSMAVRRLTPIECERLQGFPDGYTNIPWRKAAESPDGPRYKALGNSMAVPVMAWIGQRIQAVNDLPK